VAQVPNECHGSPLCLPRIVEFDAPAESFNGYQLVNALTGELKGAGRTHY